MRWLWRDDNIVPVFARRPVPDNLQVLGSLAADAKLYRTPLSTQESAVWRN